MKKIFGVILSFIALGAVLSIGYSLGGAFGSLMALSATVSIVAYVFNATAVPGQLFAAIGHIRPLVRGESNLGSVVKWLVYKETQFTPDARWPKRGKGLVSDAIPILVGETAAEWRFDIGKSKGDYQASGPITNQTFKHMIEGKASGMTQEMLDSLEDCYNMGLILVAVYTNGDRVVYGSTYAPILIVHNGSTENQPEDDGKGVSIKGESIVGCDHPPRKLASTLVISTAVVPAYPAQVNGVTP
jgi:pimeloyl-ACP methyl ester carboxylesterase